MYVHYAARELRREVYVHYAARELEGGVRTLRLGSSVGNVRTLPC